MKYSVNDFELVKFFSYTSTIPYNKRILTGPTSVRITHPNVMAAFEKFYNELIERAEFVTQYMKVRPWAYFSDNKTVFKIRRKSDGRIFYIGRYDWTFSIGTAVHQFDGTQFDFETMSKIGDYEDNYIENYKEEVND